MNPGDSLASDSGPMRAPVEVPPELKRKYFFKWDDLTLTINFEKELSEGNEIFPCYQIA
jgi:hypothetical protein